MDAQRRCGWSVIVLDDEHRAGRPDAFEQFGQTSLADVIVATQSQGSVDEAPDITHGQQIITAVEVHLGQLRAHDPGLVDTQPAHCVQMRLKRRRCQRG